MNQKIANNQSGTTKVDNDNTENNNEIKEGVFSVNSNAEDTNSTKIKKNLRNIANRRPNKQEVQKTQSTTIDDNKNTEKKLNLTTATKDEIRELMKPMTDGKKYK